MKTYIHLIFTLSIIFGLFSCTEKFDEPESITKKSIENLNISSSFDFSNSKEITVKFTSNFQSPYSIVEVYSSDPNKGGSIIASGKLQNDTYIQKMIVPSFVDFIYIRLKNSNGTSKFFTANIINNIAENSYIVSPSNKTVAFNSYNCDENCTQTINTSGSYNININEGEKLCIPEGISITGIINMNGGTLSICGTANLSNLNLNGSPHIIIGENGSLAQTNFNFNSNIKLSNYSSNYDLSSTINGSLYNYGTINHSGDITINSGGAIYNYGNINISGNLNNNAFVENNATINIENLNQNSSSQFINNCKLFIENHLIQSNSFFENNSYISIGGMLQLNSEASLQMSSLALINTNTCKIYGQITCEDNEYCRIEIASDCYLYNSSRITGVVDICDSDGIELSEGTLGSAVQYCQNIIPTTDCNLGIGFIIAEDIDNDGIINSNDRFAEDPERAFITNFPEKNEGTFAFEDLWPSKGDFDFNDIVVRYQYTLIGNAEGRIKEIEYTFKLVAVGGSFKNGFGIELPVEQGNIESNSDVSILSENIINLNNRNIESDQENAVIILFDNALNIMKHPGHGTTGINTENGSIYVQPKVFNGTITFVEAVDISNFVPFNPFIFINLDRGREVHLIGSEPTNLVNYAYFNTFNDASTSEMYYKTTENMPWALHFFNAFDYPREKAEITDAHLKFYEWASSDGNVFQDWYLDIPNYRNEDYIYHP